MSELEQITALFTRLGAEGPQAETMARQLMKRADQLAAERGVTRVAAMAQLLELVVRGRQGEAPGSPPASE